MATALRFRPLDAFYNVLNPVPFGFFVAALVFDAAYFATAEVMWGKSAAWLISIGLLFAILPCVVDLCRVWLLRRAAVVAAARVSSLLKFAGIVLAIFNAFVHSRDAYAVMPAGLWLSIATVLLLALGERSWRYPRRRWRMASLHSLRPVALALGLVLAGCNQGSQNDPQQQTGANPALPEPKHFLLPPMKVPEGVGWSGEAKPTVAQGLKIEKIADGLQHPRQLLVLPNGDVLVVEANSPGTAPVTTPKQLIAGMVKGKSGKAGKGGNRITLLRRAAPEASGRSTCSWKGWTRRSACSGWGITCMSPIPGTSCATATCRVKPGSPTRGWSSPTCRTPSTTTGPRRC